MSIVNARRRVGGKLYLDPLVNARTPTTRPIRSYALRSPQDCYVCTERMSPGDQGVFSERRRKWRHPNCVVPVME